MTLDIHRPYPGVALVATDRGSVLLGAPADAFKATKSYCERHKVPFPRVLVAPTQMLVEAVPQFNPEFFLYDFLFVYGAAFKPDLANERLVFVMEESQVESAKRALRFTLTGPTREEMQGYKTRKGVAALDRHTIEHLARLSDHMAIKKGDRIRGVDDTVTTQTFDRQGRVRVLDGAMDLAREGLTGFLVRYAGQETLVDLAISEPVVPFATLAPPAFVQSPLTFGLKALGTRSGFDLSGPTTGFVFWVNGRAVIYDGPVGTRYLLEHQGISFSDVDGIILSHCHEDHMGAFVELILAGHRPKVYTAEPVYRSALVKLASYFSRTEEDVASFIDYVRITPGQPIETLGATFDFFYTAHAIPTIGVSVSMQHDRATHRIQISGDTMHHEGIDKLREAGVLDAAAHEKLRNLVPKKKIDNALFFADVGEAIIHGHPKDWQGNPNDLVYYHCPDNQHTTGFGHHVATPGEVHTRIKAPEFHPVTPARILRALTFLDLDDPGWLNTMLYQGRTRRVDAGTILARHGDDSSAQMVSVVVSGTAVVLAAQDKAFTTLHPGEFFGMIELVNESGRHTATVQAETPMELFDIPANAVLEYVQRNGMEEALQRIWAQRPMVENIKMFRRLDVGTRNKVAGAATEEFYAANQTIIAEGSSGDDFFLLVEGEVAVEKGGKRITTLRADQIDNFFGEICAIYPERPRASAVRALGKVRTLRLHGRELRSLFKGHMAVRYLLEVAIRARGG